MQEKIGNVTLDYEYYPGEDLYSDGPVEEELLEIAKNYQEKELNQLIYERNSWPAVSFIDQLAGPLSFFTYSPEHSGVASYHKRTESFGNRVRLWTDHRSSRAKSQKCHLYRSVENAQHHQCISKS